MTITAPVPQTVSLRADLLAATAALARIALRGAELNARPSSIFLLITRSGIIKSAGSTRGHGKRPAPRSKSP